MRNEIIKIYAKYGIDVNKAMAKLAKTKISYHCWQLDDVIGFENHDAVTGGIAATGNYPGRARTFKEMISDLDEAFKYIPGAKKVNLQSIHQSDDVVDRRDITWKQFRSWVAWAKKHGYGLDINPTPFSSPKLNDGLSLSSPDKATRDYWIKHCINTIKVTEYFGKELKQKSLCNIWIPDGLKEVPSDRMGPRLRLKDSLDKILKGYKYDKKVMDVSVESKLFGIGVESYTAGSHEFYMNYAMQNGILCLLDTGHFHLTESIADKIPSLLIFNPSLAFHVSRPVRWDSDHVLKLNDDLQDVADELVKCNALDKAYIGLDYFDASLNRVVALVIGARNMQKALLRALLTPWDMLKAAQDASDHTRLLQLQEEVKTLPWTEVWEEYCAKQKVGSEQEWFKNALAYEKNVLSKRK